ncbi:cisplatin damage response ATP-dependent DNA ligase [Sphingorhabdus lacus]|uniref:DNA ligase (ATP) n=1 Tax=Sphingorhabdus lacus TaxID=392610 RepID=A0A6I6L615_9SPHN|nr:cisplatin damage response ATP-dependent DNA ligase [Sphingorhabdus lacus]QGY79396.1 cisplatin damage response ATP-dependent DNA ligase [Sphingorhabdus lacus]
MQAFAALVDALVYTRSRDAKIRLIADYLRVTPDPDRGWALAALAGTLSIATVKASAIRAMAEERFDPLLFRMSRDYVGDTAETVALMWPDNPARAAPPSVAEVIDLLNATSRARAPSVLADLMDRLDADGRYALLKLATGAMRVGISARLAKTAFAQGFGLSVDDVEEVWHALRPPYAELFAWGEGREDRPNLADSAFFRPFMLAHPLDDGIVDLSEFAAEWKWDGIRIQIAATGGETRLFSRGGDEVTAAFPEIAAAFTGLGVVDGELLVRGDVQGGEAASFNALQQRLGRKTVTAAMQAEYPVFVRLYDILFDGTEDMRALGWTQRRDRLERFVAGLDPVRFDLSALIEARDFDHLAELRGAAREAAIEGVMLKRRDAPYLAGRKVGLWYKWKREPLVADCVMMYAQRGSGKRSSYYSDYTFGCWGEDGTLLPVGKAYSGFSDTELKWLDRFVRTNTIARFGPVREVEKSLVLEVAFDAVHESKRHKSGIAMRFPRISRLRRDKPAEEADKVATLKAMIG